MDVNPIDIKPKISNSESTQAFDLVPLPTKGLVYKTGPLAGKDALEICYLNATHENILTSPNLVKSDKMVDTLLKAVIRDKSINPEDLTLVDRNTILVWLRSTGYGPEYPISLHCKDCGEKFTNEFDLSALETKYLETEPDEDGFFDFTLPGCGASIKYALMTGRDDIEINSIIKKRKNKLNSKIEATVTEKLAKIIQSIDGNADKRFIKQFIETLAVNDSRQFRQHISTTLPGIIFKQGVECPHCGTEYEEDVPILASFFWPDINN